MLLLMLQLAQLPHRPGNSHLGEGSSPIPSSLGWGVRHIPVLLEQTHRSQKGLADLGVTSCGGRKMEDRASILLLCKHLCLPPKEQPECLCQEHRTPGQPGEGEGSMLGEGHCWPEPHAWLVVALPGRNSVPDGLLIFSLVPQAPLVAHGLWQRFSARTS